MQENGSPLPYFNTDEHRTFFEVEFFIHPDFKEKAPFVIEDADLKPTIDGVDALLEKLLYYFCIKLDIVTQSTIASNIASTIAENVKNIDSQLDEKITSLGSTIAATIASTIANATTENEQKVMTKALYPQDRETFFKTIGVTNQRKNYLKFILPLVNIGWLTMTIPDKPTSPKQQYITTLKGRLLLKLLNKSRL